MKRTILSYKEPQVAQLIFSNSQPFHFHLKQSTGTSLPSRSNFMEQLVVWDETGYDIWVDEANTTPKSPYAAYLDRRPERLKKRGLTGNEPLVPNLWES